MNRQTRLKTLPSRKLRIEALISVDICLHCEGKHGEEWSPADVVDSQGAAFFSDGMQDPESLIVAMERVTLLFERSVLI